MSSLIVTLPCAHCGALPEVAETSPPIPLDVWEASCGCDHENDGETPVSWGHTVSDAVESWNEKQETARPAPHIVVQGDLVVVYCVPPAVAPAMLAAGATLHPSGVWSAPIGRIARVRQAIEVSL